jgi:hypothetical protein
VGKKSAGRNVFANPMPVTFHGTRENKKPVVKAPGYITRINAHSPGHRFLKVGITHHREASQRTTIKAHLRKHLKEDISLFGN